MGRMLSPVIFSFLLIMAAGGGLSTNSASAEGAIVSTSADVTAYWQRMLPNTPMPSAILELLTPPTGNQVFHHRPNTNTHDQQNQIFKYGPDLNTQEEKNQIFQYGLNRDTDDQKNKVFQYGRNTDTDDQKNKVFQYNLNRDTDDQKNKVFQYGLNTNTDNQKSKVFQYGLNTDADDQKNKVFLYGLNKDTDYQKNKVFLYGLNKDTDDQKNKLFQYGLNTDTDDQKNKLFQYGLNTDTDDQKNKVFQYGLNTDTDDQKSKVFQYGLNRDTDDQKNKVFLYGLNRDTDDQENKNFQYGLNTDTNNENNKVFQYGLNRDTGDQQNKKFQYGQNTDTDNHKNKVFQYSLNTNTDDRKNKVFQYGGGTNKMDKKTQLLAPREGTKESNDLPRNSMMSASNAREAENDGESLHTHGDITMAFFLEEALTPGSTVTPYIPSSSTSGALLLQHDVASSIPMSTGKFTDIIKMSTPVSHAMANDIWLALDICENSLPVKGEKRTCATSMESMVKFAASVLTGGNTRNLRAFSSPDVPVQGVVSGRKYKVSAARRTTESSESVTCHGMSFPYAVFMCHAVNPTKVYTVALEKEEIHGGGPDRMEVLAVCHLDTSDFNPRKMPAHVKPGDAPICHFIARDSILWAPVRAAAAA